MGIFCLVLHTHLPYVRRNGVWPSGEDHFHQAAVESYLPLLGVLERLADDGLTDVLTMSISPMVAHQMADEHMLRELHWYLGNHEVRTWQQVANYDGVFAPEFKDLAAFYARFAREQGERLDELGPGGIASAFASLDPLIEILGGPATHPFLPRVSEPALAHAQLSLGLAEGERLLRTRARGLWMPECAYAPGMEVILSEHGVEHVVVDGPVMLRSGGTTGAPRRIGDSDVVAFARNLDVTYRVWSPTGGYPTGRWYRDFFHYDVEGGFKDWRVTGVQKPLDRKRPYEPADAAAAARADAEVFASLVADASREGIVVAAYDTELFGHWWFEGPIFLEHLFRTLASHPDVRPMSLAAAREVLDLPDPIALVEGSWGLRKDDRSWVGDETEPMWKALATIEAETVRAMTRFGPRGGATAQMVREALLAQSSDWPFMVLRGRNPDYARERFEGHHTRWQHMLDLVRGHAPDDIAGREAQALFEIDNVLPDLDPTAL